jgi:hypothetical protein
MTHSFDIIYTSAAKDEKIVTLNRKADKRSKNLIIFCKKLQGKADPLQAWSGPDGSKKLRFPDFMTTAQDGGKFVSLTHRPPLPPGKYTWYFISLRG